MTYFSRIMLIVLGFLLVWSAPVLSEIILTDRFDELKLGVVGFIQALFGVILMICQVILIDGMKND